MLQRLQKILASAGIASRRKSEELIAAGRVTLNGKVAAIGQSADPEKDIIKVDNQPIKFERKLYIVLNKPKGFVTTVTDKFADRKVVDLVEVKERVFPVGRLDKDSEGLIILTNDGDFANRVMHPRYNVDKAYTVALEKPIDDSSLGQLRKGVVIDKVKTWPAELRLLSPDRKIVEIIIHEGRHKIVKRIFKYVGNYVITLTRTRIGSVTLKGLGIGSWRNLTDKEVQSFK